MAVLRAGSLCLLWSHGCIYDPPVAEGTPVRNGCANTVTHKQHEIQDTALQWPSFITGPRAGLRPGRMVCV